MTPTPADAASKESVAPPPTGPTVSIVVNNYNYADYVGEAIESALAQDHPDVEVVVVDDGSSDGSWSVIERYADRVRAVRQDNGGQVVAGRTGLDHSSGEIVIFLDADDFLASTAASRVAAAWRPGYAKVQYRLTLVGPDSVPFGTDPPWEVPLPSGDLTGQLQATGRYESPVTSGNAYPRTLLDRLFPFPDGFDALDSYLNTVAPLYGPVLSLDEELGAYRQHARNRWAFSGGVDVGRLRDRITCDLTKEAQLHREAAALGFDIPTGHWRSDPDHLVQRLGSLRLDPAGHPARADRRLTLLRLGLAAVARSAGGVDRLYRWTVLLALAVLPRVGVRAVVRFTVGGQRPEWLRAFVRLLRRRQRTSMGPA